MSTDHLPMATGTSRIDRFWDRAHSYLVYKAIADDAEAEAERAGVRAADARMRADDARLEMRRAADALTDDERDGLTV